jgi:uncharacterized protein (TIGR02271 family)
MVFRDDAQPRRDTDALEVTRSEEQLLVNFDRVPYRRVRLVKYVTTEEVTRTFQVRREQLRVEPEDVADAAPIEPWAARLTVDEPLELTLSDEQVVIETKIVPRERVRVWVEDVPAGEQSVQGTLAKEQIEVVDPSRGNRRPFRQET